MIESMVVLAKVGVVCVVGLGVATGFEWFTDLEIKPKNKSIQLGKGKEGENNGNDEIKLLREKSRSRG